MFWSAIFAYITTTNLDSNLQPAPINAHHQVVMADKPYQAGRAFVSDVASPAVGRIMAYLPDTIIFGTLIFSFLTMSYPLLILLLFQFEVILAQKFSSSLFRTLFPTLTIPNGSEQCIEGYYNNPSEARKSIMNLFGPTGGSFPSRPLFLLTAVLTYMMTAFMSFQSSIENLGEDYVTRSTISTVGSAILVLTVFILYWRNGCETFLHGITTILFGVGIGVGGLFLHRAIFGDESINLLGLPVIVNKLDKGTPLAICAPTVN